MIQGVLGEFAPEGEADQVPAAVEQEEGPSSTLGKEEVKDEKATFEIQIAEIPTEQAKNLPV